MPLCYVERDIGGIDEFVIEEQILRKGGPADPLQSCLCLMKVNPESQVTDISFRRRLPLFTHNLQV